MKKTVIGIFIFNEVEVLDFAGPFEVFSLAEDTNSQKYCDVVTIGQYDKPLRARNGLQVIPDFTFENHPLLDILLVPGGYGAEEIEIKNEIAISWIRSQKSQVKILASVCTGAFLLAEAGLLSKLKVTTHWMDIKKLKKEYPELIVLENIKFVDEGEIVTSAGISAGINMSFHLLERLFGKSVSVRTAKKMEYDIEL